MVHSILDYGNTQLTNQIASLAVSIFVSYLFRGNYFAALRHFSYAHAHKLISIRKLYGVHSVAS